MVSVRSMDLRSTPKVDLHRHLEGAIRLDTVLELMREAGEPLPEANAEELAPRAQVLEPMDSLQAVLARFDIAQRAFTTPEACERIAAEAVEDLARDEVRLAELRLSPHFLCEPHGLDWDEAFASIVRGVERAARETRVAVGLIAIASRNYGHESAERTADFAIRHREDLVAFDLAGDERAYPPSMYVDVIPRVRDAGLHVTTHYGESTGPAFPREAIEALGTERLGHGVGVAGDPEVIALARDRGVALEMCPTSNVRTGGVRRLDEHPARRLLDEDVPVTINTDNPGLFAIDLTHELETCVRELGFTDDDVRRVTRNAIDASFVDEGRKRDVARRFFAWTDA
jgi:adenosine deaminase